MKTIKAGSGYWDTTNDPIGSVFRRAPESGLKIIKVIRAIPGNYRGVSEEGVTEEGRKIAYNSKLCELKLNAAGL